MSEYGKIIACLGESKERVIKENESIIKMFNQSETQKTIILTTSNVDKEFSDLIFRRIWRKDDEAVWNIGKSVSITKANLVELLPDLENLVAKII